VRLLVCGSRLWKDERVVGQSLRRIKARIEVVIHGGARGADYMANRQAERLNLPIEVYPANWDRDGKGAGPIRNQQMLDEALPDWVFAFTDDIEASRGTADMVRRSMADDRVTHVFLYDGVGWAVLKKVE
jgi:hypothetical protein